MYGATAVTSNASTTLQCGVQDVYVGTSSSSLRSAKWDKTTPLTSYKYLHILKVTPKKITANVSTGGTVYFNYNVGAVKITDLTQVEVGKTIIIHETPNTGYILKNIVVKSASGTVLNTSNMRQFKMPNEDVTVTVTFEKENQKHKIIIDASAGGTVQVKNASGTVVTEAYKGEKLTIVATPDMRYKLKDLLAFDSKGNPVAVINNTIEMPEDDVTIKAEFYNPSSVPLSIESVKVTKTKEDSKNGVTLKAVSDLAGTMITGATLNYSWYTVQNGTEKLISDWSTSDTFTWKPSSGYGELTVYAKAKLSRVENTPVKSNEVKFEYHPEIKGICQMPYGMVAPGEPGYLIGIQNYEDTKAVTVEMLILDCTTMKWVYATGANPVGPENEFCLWTVWQPQYGYYWTLFRAYDKNGTIIDEICYGFENI